MTNKQFSDLLEQMSGILKKIDEHTVELVKVSKRLDQQGALLDQHSKMHKMHLEHGEKVNLAMDKILIRLEKLEN
ncbi:MAG: hypothetical protein AAGF85_18550 [Bacteroidota bacterium]